MKCPVDGTVLARAERGDVEVDYCPRCRGIWLDRGDLDRILEQSGVAAYRDEYDESYRQRRAAEERCGAVRGRHAAPVSALADLLSGED